MKIANNLIALRSKNNLTYKEFARELGVNERTIHRWMSGEREPSLRHLKQIIDRFEISDVYEFVYGEKEQPKKLEIPKLVYLY